MIEKRDCHTKVFTIMHNPFFMSFVVGRGSFGENANKYKIILSTDSARAPHVGAPTPDCRLRTAFISANGKRATANDILIFSSIRYERQR